MKKMMILFVTALGFLSSNQLAFAQQQDTTKEKPVQFRRGIELQEGYQSYDDKYAGKNLNEEKRSLFPLRDGTGVWTELNPKVPRVDYLGVHFINKDTGWACGDLSALIKTTDGGESWTVSETNTTTPILKVRSFNGQVVIASGYNGLILRSADGGETFTQVTSGVTGDLWGLQVINDTLGWACGTGNSLVKTTDAGLTWQTVTTPGYTSDYWWIDFLDEDYGFIAADGKVLRTIDGGQNWEIIQAGDNQALYSIDIIDSMHIAAAGFGGTSYRGKNIYSSDGGYTWIVGGPLTFEPVNCIKYVNPDTGYVILDEVGIWKTTNRGESWTSLGGVVGNIGEWELQFFEEENIGYNAGSGLRIYKADGNLDVWSKLILNDNFADVYFNDEQIGYAAAFRLIYKTTNGGEIWSPLQSFPSNVFTTALNSLIFTDSLTGFAGGPPCRIVKTTDAGNSWYVTNRTGLTDTIGSINRFFFINPTTGWAVSSRGGILKTTDGGENWFAQLEAGSFVIFQNIYFVDSLYGWTANLVQWPFKTSDGGSTWVQQTNLNIFSLTDIYFSHADTGYVVSSSATNPGLYKTINSGLNWSLVTGINSPRTFGFFPNKYHWLVHGFGGYVYETQDGGNSFTDISNAVPSTFIRFSAPENYIGYAVGSLGLVLRYFDSTYVPVELISFDGRIENDKIILNWRTASELNNKGFEIEKSLDKENWFSIGFIEGNGTTTESNYYSFIDNEIARGVQFYRLKQIDFDGRCEYSKIIEVDIDLTITSFQLFQNYPNPFNSSTIITYQVPNKSKINISLYDIKGARISELVNKEKAKGLYKTTLENLMLPSGIYFVRMITSTGYSAVIKLTLLK